MAGIGNLSPLFVASRRSLFSGIGPIRRLVGPAEMHLAGPGFQPERSFFAAMGDCWRIGAAERTWNRASARGSAGHPLDSKYHLAWTWPSCTLRMFPWLEHTNEKVCTHEDKGTTAAGQARLEGLCPLALGRALGRDRQRASCEHREGNRFFILAETHRTWRRNRNLAASCGGLAANPRDTRIQREWKDACWGKMDAQHVDACVSLGRRETRRNRSLTTTLECTSLCQNNVKKELAKTEYIAKWRSDPESGNYSFCKALEVSRKTHQEAETWNGLF